MKQLLFAAERLLYKAPEGAPKLPDTINEVQRRLNSPEKARTLTVENMEATLQDLDEFSARLDEGEKDTIAKFNEQLDEGSIDAFERDNRVESLKAEYAKLREKVKEYRKNFEEVLDTLKKKREGILTEKGREFLTLIEQTELSDKHQELVDKYGTLMNEMEQFHIGGSCGEAVVKLMDKARELGMPDSNWTMEKYEEYDSKLTQYETNMTELAQSGEAALLEYKFNETNYQEYAGKNGKIQATLNSEWTKEYPELRAEMEKLAKDLKTLGAPDENKTLFEEQEEYQVSFTTLTGEFKVAFEKQGVERNRREVYAKAKAAHDEADSRLMDLSVTNSDVPEEYKTAVTNAASGLEDLGELPKTASAQESMEYKAKVEEIMDKFNAEFAANEKAYETAKSQYEVVKKSYDLALTEYTAFQFEMINEALFGNSGTVKEYQAKLIQLGVPKEPKLGGTETTAVYETYVKDLKSIESKFQLAIKAKELEKIGATKIAGLLDRIKGGGAIPTIAEITQCESDDLRNIVYNTEIENQGKLKQALGAVVGEMIILAQAKEAGGKVLAQLKKIEDGLTGAAEYVKQVDRAAAEYVASQAIGEYQEPAPEPKRDIAAEMALPEDQSVMPGRPDVANIDNDAIRARMQKEFEEQAKKEELAKKAAERKRLLARRKKKDDGMPKLVLKPRKAEEKQRTAEPMSPDARAIVEGHARLQQEEMLKKIDAGMDKALKDDDSGEYQRLAELRGTILEDDRARRRGGGVAGFGDEVPGNR